jgi:CopG antitoxin of type II toxin-antitoxin system
MPAIPKNKLPKHLQFDYSGAKTLAEMDEIDGSAEFMRDLIDSGVYEPGGRLHGYEPVERINPRRERITMSIPSANLIHLKMLANRKEIPYQTYLNSMIKEHLDREFMTK